MVELRHVENLFGVEIARVVLIDLLETSVELLDLFLGELTWKFGVSHYVIINRVGMGRIIQY